MDLINDKLSKVYLKYLTAAFGSAFMGSVFGLVDMVMVGQYHGPEGSAAMGVIAPVWNIVYSFGLLAGIGGSVLFSVAKGSDGHGESPENAYFTGSVIFGGIIALLLWVGLWLFEVPLLRLFGANDALLPLCLRYLIPVKFTVPFYPFSTLLSSFLRNDGNPALATKSVMFGGIFNIFGDYFFVFTLDMGILGAAPTAAVLAIAPEIMRIYAVSFLLLPYNVFSTYYFQAMLRPGTSIIISVSRGIVISGALIMLLPLILGSNSVWFAMPIAEAATAVYVTASIAQVQKAFQKPEC